MSSPSSSAQAQLQVLADRLRELRVDAGLTGIELAVQLGWDRTKVSHVEHARRAPSADGIRAWCRACGAAELADDLIESLRTYEGAYVAWQRMQRTGLRRLQESYVPLYEQTRVFRIYSSLVIPGHLQTPGYTRGMFTAITRRRGIHNDIDDAVGARTARQRILREGDHKFALVLDEAALLHTIGSPEVMVEQCKHLLATMTLPSVSLSIIPAATRPAQWPLETFTIYDATQVHVELLAARVTMTSPSEIQLYEAAFNDLTAAAVHGRRARQIIDDAAERHSPELA